MAASGHPALVSKRPTPLQHSFQSPRQTPRHPSSKETVCRSHCSRSEVLRSAPAGLVAGCVAADLLLNAQPAEASLVLLPTNELNNTYFLVRAGETEAERDGYVDSNPVNKTSMSNGLSEEGKRQVTRQAYPVLRDLGVGAGASWFWPSTTQNSYQTAEILAYLFGVGREKIVPEYSFLDMRGLGIFDGLPPSEAFAKIHEVDALDYLQRPPPTDTGTPNESAEDVYIRARQLLSVTEAQYYGATVVVISPDSENLSIMQAAVMGKSLREHATLGFSPGEARPLVLAKEALKLFSGSIPCKRPPQCR
ncbi:hypothetical protein BSKO_11607 [Bryopsis sp. KO-2023]|nr:hypothetical protein BSKO_11607 [Bryopsis sp. KO-2023]